MFDIIASFKISYFIDRNHIKIQKVSLYDLLTAISRYVVIIVLEEHTVQDPSKKFT